MNFSKTFFLKISLLENETTLNLKSGSFIVIMLLHEGLTYTHSQIKPRLLFGESFTLKMFFMASLEASS